MIIGIDFDGTIADTNSEKSKWIQKELGMKVPPYLCDRTSCVPIIGELDYKRMCNTVYSKDITLSLPAFPSSLEVISMLQKSNKLMVITARTEETLEAAMIWLSKYPQTKNMEAIGVSKEMHKTEVCYNRGINVLIDDDERHLLDASSLGITAILFKQSAPNLSSSNVIHICGSWDEISSYLQNLEEK